MAAPQAATPQTVTPPTAPDLTYALPMAGYWTFAPTSDGSAATFLSPSAMPQLAIRCSRATRRVSISRAATGAAPFLYVWTSSLTRGVPASFDPATARLTIQLAAYDPLLDALAFARGRFAVYVAGSPALVLPAWPEVVRVIEDCRN
ncbi:MAG: hypothetical protein ACJ8EV_10965 [Sphingomicrobium sp.]